MEKLSVEDIIIRLISHFGLKNMSELAEKLNVSQSVMSNWKSRNAIGAICEKILEVDSPALSKIFSDTQNNIITNSEIGGSGVNNGETTINNASSSFNCDEFTKTLLQQLCVKYKNDQNTLQTLIFKLIQNANAK